MSEAHVEQAPMAHDHHATLAEDDRPNLRAIIIWFVGIVLSVVAAVIFIHEYFGIHMRKEIAQKVLSAENPVLRDLRAQEHASLSKYQWVDKKAGVVRIPVERAQELVLRDWSARPKTLPAAAPAEAGQPSLPSEEPAKADGAKTP